MAAKTDLSPLKYDHSGVMGGPNGLSQTDFDQLAPKLNQARDEIATDIRLFGGDGTIPSEKEPLDAGFVDLPQRLLSDYNADPNGSELGRILATAKRLQEEVDRVVILGIGGSYMGARALMDSCCPPYFNELSREDRGGRPRIYFEGNNVDNDHSQALLKLLGNSTSGSVDESWGIVVISKSGGTLETAVAFRQFLSSLESSCGGDADRLARLVVPVTGETGKLADLADAIGCQDRFLVPDGVGGRFSILSAVGLLPAAIMGLDVIALLQAAVEMTERFRTEPAGNNPVMDYVAACHLLEEKHGVDQRVLSVWSKSLETTGLWYDQLLAESLGKHERGALPLTVVNTRDLHSRAQQHQEGKRDKLMTNVVVEQWRQSPLQVGESDRNQDGLNIIAEKALPEVMNAAIQGTNEAYQSDGRPTADIQLATTDESSLGQFYQMMMLATVLEGRLIGINPYGQPGVESYKVNMKRILGMP